MCVSVMECHVCHGTMDSSSYDKQEVGCKGPRKACSANEDFCITRFNTTADASTVLVEKG